MSVVSCASRLALLSLFAAGTAAAAQGGRDGLVEQVWAWKANGRGVFADLNPAVSCEHAH